MNAVIPESFYQRREHAAQLGTLTLAILILFLSKNIVMRQDDVPAEERLINLTIVEPPPNPEQVIEQPPKVVPPPHPVEKMVEQPKVIVPVPLAPAPIAIPVAPIKPVEPEPVKQEVIRPPALISNAAAEGQFAEDVRSRIERKKIYPDTARDLGMSGEVEILYELDRLGNLVRAEIVASSGYRLLDQAALKAVKTAAYKKFPSDAWVGEGSKVFRTKLVFSINQ